MSLIRLLALLLLVPGIAFGQARVSTPPAPPPNEINAANYGVIYDGQDNYFTATTSGTSLTIGLSATGAALTTSIASGTNVLTVVLSDGSFVGFQQSDVGKRIMVPGAGPAGATLFSTITGVVVSGTVSASQITIADNASTTLSAVSTALLWPYFLPTDVGKTIWVEQAGAKSGVRGSGSNYLQQPLLTTISAYVGPTQVTLTASAATLSGIRGIRIVWGTENTNALVAARAAAQKAGLRYITFNAQLNANLLCTAFNLPVLGVNADATGNEIWQGIGVKGFFTDSSGSETGKQIVPAAAQSPTPPAPQQRFILNRDAPRFSATANPVVDLWGDSMCTDSPAQSGSWSQITRIEQRLRSENPGKTITFNNRCIGGAIAQWLIGIEPGPSWPVWYTNHTLTWQSYVQADNPDMVILADSGANDSSAAYAPAFQTLINQIKTVFTKDASGRAPDILMLNARAPTNVNNVNYLTVPAQQGREYVSTLLRTMARNQGIGFLDYYSQSALSRDGWSPTNLFMQAIPEPSDPAGGAGTLFPGPYSMLHKVRDFDFTWWLAYANGSTAWSTAGTVSVQIGANYGNVAKLSTDGNGFLTVEGDTWGSTVPSTVSVSGSPAVVTTSGTSTITATTVAFSADLVTGGTTVTFTGAGSFTNGNIGGSIIIPGAQYTYTGAGTHVADWRTTIIGVTSATVITVADPPPNGGASLGSTNVTYGPMLFVPTDATAGADIVIPGAGTAGANLISKVAIYTSPTQVTLADNTGTTLSGSTQSIFLGRIFLPKFSTAISATLSPSANPLFQVSAKGDNLYVTYRPYGTYTSTNTITINSGSPNLSSTAAVFVSDMVGLPITVPGAGTSGTTLSSYIQTVTDSTHAVLTDNAGTTVTGASKLLTIGPSPKYLAYSGPAERFGGPFYPLVNASATQTFFHNYAPAALFIGKPQLYAPQLVDLEEWGSTDNYSNLGGNGINHNTDLQGLTVDGQVLNAQTWSAVASGSVSGLGTLATQNASAVAITGGTITGVTGLNGSGAEQTISFQPGLITAITSTKGVFGKFVKASTVDNIVGSATSFSCASNPTITMYECGTDGTCAAPTTIGTVTVTAAGTSFDGTVSNAAIGAAHYVAFALTSGTCVGGLDVSVNAQVHAN